ncbi:hypothetical protein R1flu_007132 [Riccia fluitans]|uniref:Uncharacterized protein n=1 Tax=Riccia fluitans TaxID=41844 RepID=A0ABD1YY78_9MARC
MDRFLEAVAHRPAHIALFEQMKVVFDSYVNPIAKTDQEQLIAGLDRTGFNVDQFLGRVPHATPADEVTPSRQGGSDYLEEVGACTLARLQCEISIIEGSSRSNPLRMMYAGKPSQSPPMEPTVHEDHQSPIDVQDGSSVPNDVLEDPYVEESSARNAKELEMVLYTP